MNWTLDTHVPFVMNPVLPATQARLTVKVVKMSQEMCTIT